MTASAAALEVRDLTAGYGEAMVLHHVSIGVPQGSVVALLGPNGAGKSTLLRTVSGLVRARRGTVAIQGRDVTTERPHRRARAGLCHIPERRGIYPSLTVRENLLMQGPRGRERESLERASAAFPVLGTRLRQLAGTLSGGQQQMLALAAAYVRDPTLVLVDEASLGLAPIVIDEIFEFLRGRAAAGTAILLVDQYATRALALAENAYVLRKGRVVYAGAADERLGEELFNHYLGVDAEGAQAG